MVNNQNIAAWKALEIYPQTLMANNIQTSQECDQDDKKYTLKMQKEAPNLLFIIFVLKQKGFFSFSCWLAFLVLKM